MRYDDHIPYTANAKPKRDLHELSIHLDDPATESHRAGLGLFGTAQIRKIAAESTVSQPLI